MFIKGSVKKGILLVLILLLNFACTTSRVATKQDTQIPKSAPPEFEVVLWTDHRDNTYQIGEDIYFFFAGSKDCYVTILDINNDGKVRILLPNEYHMDNQARAGYVYRIPSQSAKFRLKARNPIGESIVVVIATLEDITLYDLKDEQGLSPASMKDGRSEEAIYRKLKWIDPSKWTQYKTKIRVINKS